MALKATNDHLIKLISDLAKAQNDLEIFIVMTPDNPPYIVRRSEDVELPYTTTPGGMVIDVKGKRYATAWTSKSGYETIDWKKITTWL